MDVSILSDNGDLTIIRSVLNNSYEDVSELFKILDSTKSNNFLTKIVVSFKLVLLSV